jgi:hypothetical protein
LALVVTGWLFTMQGGSSHDRKVANQAVDQAQTAAAGVAFQQAEAQLEQFRAESGTYAGASLAGFGVTLVRADASSYCLQLGTSHLAGPGGSPAAGPC